MDNQTILYWLNERDPDKCAQLFSQAYQIKKAHVGATVYLRGIVEISNVCRKNCFYCGIRKAGHVKRYTMQKQEILDCARFAHANGLGSLVLQGGEQSGLSYVTWIEQIVTQIKDIGRGALGITLSLGEQTGSAYQRWFEKGAHRYLLRIETSSEDLYRRLHPADHSYHDRLRCLRDLKEIGYQVGTGVMIGLPYQTSYDLLRDVVFFKDFDIDMIGMGPYIPHPETPLNSQAVDPRENFSLSLKMIALCRIVMPDINIAATTALQALDPRGREKALLAGANVIMPNITPVPYRADYQLYNHKPCVSEDAVLCADCLSSRIQSIGENVGYGQWGDSIHFYKRQG